MVEALLENAYDCGMALRFSASAAHLRVALFGRSADFSRLPSPAAKALRSFLLPFAGIPAKPPQMMSTMMRMGFSKHF